jgi:hypothetical protein
MRPIYEFAEFLTSSWRLANPGRPLPISDGRLDMALEAVVPSGPERFRDLLSFGNTRAGYTCYELADVLHAAYGNLLVTAPTPAHLAVDVVIDDTVASILLRRRGLAREEAAEFGRRLAAEIGQ